MRRRAHRASLGLDAILTSAGFLLSFISLLAIAGCDAKTEPAASTASPSSARSAPAGTSAKPLSSATLRPAKAKAYGETSEQDLGTLPEGVGIAVGETAPDFELEDAQGKKLELSELRKKSDVLLVFYRGGW